MTKKAYTYEKVDEILCGTGAIWILFGSGSRRRDVCGRGMSATHPKILLILRHPKIGRLSEIGSALVLAWGEEIREAGI